MEVEVSRLNVSKAFVCENRQKLLTRLVDYCIRGSIHKLIESYLGNRFQVGDGNR